MGVYQRYGRAVNDSRGGPACEGLYVLVREMLMWYSGNNLKCIRDWIGHFCDGRTMRSTRDIYVLIHSGCFSYFFLGVFIFVMVPGRKCLCIF